MTQKYIQHGAKMFKRFLVLGLLGVVLIPSNIILAKDCCRMRRQESREYRQQIMFLHRYTASNAKQNGEVEAYSNSRQQIVVIDRLPHPRFTPRTMEFPLIEKSVERLAVERINLMRAIKAEGRLSLDEGLSEGCKKHSRWMAQSQRLEHASGYNEVIAVNPYAGLVYAIENQWRNSPGHYEMLTSGNFTKCGIAVTKDKNGYNWCVVSFK